MRIERREKYKSLLEARWKLCSVIVFDSLSQTLFLEEREMNESTRWLSCELVKFYVNKSEVTWVSDMTYNVSSIGRLKRHVKWCQLSNNAVACVAWRFWLGALSNKGRQGQRNCEEIGAGATWFLFFSRLRRSFSRALRANFGASTLVRRPDKPPCYAG